MEPLKQSRKKRKLNSSNGKKLIVTLNSKTNKNNSSLGIPRGFRDILPVEARLRERITNRVQTVFDLWGYEPVETPTLEFVRTLQGERDLESASFRLLDTDGDLLCLRPDVTIPLARLVAMRLTPLAEPLRLRYRQTVFREEAALRAESRAFTQIGIEYIGESGILADAEILLLLGEALKVSGLEGFTIAFCDVSALRALLQACQENGGGTADWTEQVLLACHRSDFVEVDRLSRTPGLDSAYGQALRLFVNLNGGWEAALELRQLLSPLVAPENLSMLDSLEKTAWLAENCGPAGVYRIDFSVMSAFSYYTGLICAAYAPGIGTPLARGGRYDTTLANFGAAAPAAGFALNLERVVTQVMAAATPTPQEPTALTGAAAPAAPADPINPTTRPDPLSGITTLIADLSGAAAVEVIETDANEADLALRRASQLRAQGQRVIIREVRR